MTHAARNSLGLPGRPQDCRIAVAMSGGVDSSVTAALLKEEGYDVFGVTLQLYDDGAARAKAGACCAGQDIRDARRVAEAIGIPHYVLDYEQRFRAAVMQDFADAYARGETPIPCVRCNERVKFGDLLDTARDLGALALATGHYVRRVDGPQGPELRRPADAARDQSYFLFATTRAQLAFLRFPLGDLPKEAVRAQAARLGLSVADKPDSQDICFVPQGSYARVVERLRPGAADPGDIVHVDGRVLGRHAGVIHFTVGQRKGLAVTAAEALFVVRLDAAKRQVVVGPRGALATASLRLSDVTWIGDAPLGADPVPVRAKVRSTRPAKAATVRAAEGGALVHLDEADAGVAPGQACVFYDAASGDRVLGGGWIRRTAPSPAPVPALAGAP